MMNASRIGAKPGESGWLWLAKLFTGLAIIVLLIVHFVVNHFIAGEGLLRHEDVVAYYNNPLIVIMEAVFLIFVISHALIGTRSIILDLRPSPRMLRVIDVLLLLTGIFFSVYGIWILLAVVAQIA
jgi:succinate dehydrogenase / fumarate reductase membrane anchor subunit